MNLNNLIRFAYDLNPKQLTSTPKWLKDGAFDLNGSSDTEGRPNTRQLTLLIEAVLSDRFRIDGFFTASSASQAPGRAFYLRRNARVEARDLPIND